MAKWDSKAIELLKTLWMQGHSGGSIQKRLQEEGYTYTRNAVIAQVHRSKLPPRGKTLYPSRPTSAKPRPVKIATAKIKKPKGPPAPRFRTIPRGQNSLRHAEASDHQCKMFCDGEAESQGYVCGNPTDHPPWCKQCRSIVYQPIDQKRRVA